MPIWAHRLCLWGAYGEPVGVAVPQCHSGLYLVAGAHVGAVYIYCNFGRPQTNRSHSRERESQVVVAHTLTTQHTRANLKFAAIGNRPPARARRGFVQGSETQKSSCIFRYDLSFQHSSVHQGSLRGPGCSLRPGHAQRAVGRDTPGGNTPSPTQEGPIHAPPLVET